MGEEEDREQNDHRHARRIATHVRGDAIGKPLDETDAVESIAESDQGTEPRKRGPSTLVICNIAPRYHSRDQHQADRDRSNRRCADERTAPSPPNSQAESKPEQ